MNLLAKTPPPPKNKTGWPWTEETDSSIYNPQKDWPKISIVTPSYNQGEFIEETIRSILLQNYPNLEYIIIDGGSTDNTVEIIKKYEKWITYWVSEPDKGQAHAINKGFKIVKGEIINWLNSDDYLLKNALYYVGKFEWKEQIGGLIGRGHKISINGHRWYSPYPTEVSTEGLINWNENNFMQPACFFKNTVFKEVGGIDENLYGCFDVDLWIKISQKYKFELLDKHIAHAYIQENAKTVKDIEKVTIETYLMIVRHGAFNLAQKYSFELIDELLIYKEYYNKHSGNIFYDKCTYLINRVKYFVKSLIKSVKL